MKIDMHMHCALQRKEMPPTPYDPNNYVADAPELMEHLKSQGIFKAVLQSGSDDSFSGNEASAKIASMYPEFFSWMCNIFDGDINTVEDRMAQYKAQGAIGVGELSVNQWIDSPFLTAVFSAAEKLEMPITFHMSPEPGFSYGICDRPGLPLLEQALQRFPKLKLLGHSQVFWLEISADCPREGNRERSAMGKGAVIPGGRVEQLMRGYPNLYGDLSAYSGSLAMMRDEKYGLAFMEEFSDRLFFGTDTVNKHQTFPLGAYLDRCAKEGRLSQQAYENICYKNAQRIFHL